MDSEESRLRTFINWPENAVVDARRIATAGFYYMGQGQEVQCFSCGGRISEWNIGDSVMARHRALDSYCPFVVNPQLSGNIPLSSERRIPNVNLDKKYHNEKCRLETFSTWPIGSIISPELLAKSGFYFTQAADKVKCAYCHGSLQKWEAGDDPDFEHRRLFPECSFMKAKALADIHSGVNFRDSTSAAVTTSMETLKDLGVQDHRLPCHAKYSTYDSRLKTFNQWPPSLSQKPHDLADAGFYFTGRGDQVRCFHCDGGLRLWERDDDPWTEHAHWFPKCGFTLLIKGQEFVEEVNMNLTELSNTPQSMAPKTRSASPSKKINPVTEEELQSQMNTPNVMTVLEMGIEASRIKQALKQRLEYTGMPFPTPDALVVAALEVQIEQIASADNDDWSTPPDSPSLSRLRRNYHVVTNGSLSSDSVEEEEVEFNHQNIQNRPKEEVALPPAKEEPIKKSTSETDTASVVNTPLSLEEENRRLKEARLCKICMDIEAGVLFLPCRHLVTCTNCAHSLAACPFCRKPIKATVRAFLS